MHPFTAVFSLLLVSLAAQAAGPTSQDEVLATRGKGVVTQDAFSARADKIPAETRLGTLRDAGRLKDLINTLLLRAQLAADAREAGFDAKAIVVERMRLAAEFELAEAWLQHYVESRPEADYEQLAREYYQLHRQEIMTAPSIDVSHILVSTKDRSAEEALELAASLAERLAASPADFDDLVAQYSEDPSAASNQGRFTKVEKGDMVRAFEDAAFSMQPGEISAPVRTQYGFHIIRLDARHAPEPLAFEAVREQLVERERKQHDERIRQDYLNSLTALEVNMSEEALSALVDRLFGEDYVDPFTTGIERR